MFNALTMDHYPLTLTTVVERAEDFHDAEVVAMRADGRLERTTLSRCVQRSRSVAAALAALGVTRGDRVATLLWNQTEHLELYFAVPAMGAVIHTLNPRLHSDELAYIVQDAEDAVLVVDESLLEVYESFRHAYRFKHIIVVTRNNTAPAETLDYQAIVEVAPPMSWPVLDDGSAAAMCYTSGTTGRPKGVVYSHRALVLHSMVVALPDSMGLSRRDTLLPVVPMFHANAWGIPYAGALVGSRLVLPGPRLDPESILDLVADQRVTMAAGVPTVWMGMLSALDAEPQRWDLSNLERLVVGGSAVSRALFEGFDRHGLTIIQAWGMTETAPVGSVSRLPVSLENADPDAQYDSRVRQGTAVPFVELRAIDDGGNPIEWNDTALGELEVRGPWVAAAYHKGIGADSFTADGWFRTGDIVRIDRQGSIRVCDRAKDLVKSGGEWISSVDLENCLMGHPAVAEAAVIAIPDSRWGERPLAVLVMRDGMTAHPSELRSHLLADFAKWQIPERFEFLTEIPRTATGKFRKTELRQKFAPE